MTIPEINSGHPDQVLKDRFTNLWQRCLTDGCFSDPEPIWRSVERYYSELHRHYHDKSHLVHCLAELDSAGDQMSQVDPIELAVWFHDIIHEPAQSDNEARSAQLFRALADGFMDPAFVQTVVDLIMVTTHRDPPQVQNQQYICDIDLSSFGVSWDRFLQDSINLQQEFSGPIKDYYSGKQIFLGSLLDRPRIFFTEFFYDRYERRARENIRRILQLIEERGTINTDESLLPKSDP